jgi:hypothetical protein
MLIVNNVSATVQPAAFHGIQLLKHKLIRLSTVALTNISFFLEEEQRFSICPILLSYILYRTSRCSQPWNANQVF